MPHGETQDAIEGSLTFALLFGCNRARQSSSKGNISFLRLILPEGKARLLALQLASLDSHLTVRVYELNLLAEHLERLDPRTNGNVNSWPIPHRESEMLLNRAKTDLDITALASDVICGHAVPHEQEVVFCFRGLPFLRWKDGNICFGLGAAWKELCARNEPELKQLILNLKSFRNPLAGHPRHPLYRAQTERWQ